MNAVILKDIRGGPRRRGGGGGSRNLKEEGAFQRGPERGGGGRARGRSCAMNYRGVCSGGVSRTPVSEERKQRRHELSGRMLGGEAPKRTALPDPKRLC